MDRRNAARRMILAEIAVGVTGPLVECTTEWCVLFEMIFVFMTAIYSRVKVYGTTKIAI